jgi:CheY-like chemotaxis protein
MANAILLAEDFEDDVNVVRMALDRMGVTNPVIRLADGDDVIAYLSGAGIYSDRLSFPIPGILLLDLKMPRVSGFQVLEWIQTRAELRDMLVVVLSGHHEIQDIARAYSLGADSFLCKPCDPIDLANLIQRFEGYWSHATPLPPAESVPEPQQRAQAS